MYAAGQAGRTGKGEWGMGQMPCSAQEPNFTDVGGGMQRISPQFYPDDSRVLARVLCGGYVAAGDRVAVYRSPRATSGRVVRSRAYSTAFVSEEYMIDDD